MTSPVQLSDLDVATSADDADVTLLRKGLTDYQCPVSLIRTIDVSALPDASNPNSTDYLLLNQGAVNKKIFFSQAGFLKGTQAWFYQNVAPALWAIVPNTGDRLLAVKGGTTNYNINGGTQNLFADWLIPGTTLTIDQIPSHSHMQPMDDTNGHSTTKFTAGQTGHSAFRYTQGYPTGGAGSNQFTSNGNANAPSYNFPATNPHTHPASYRPAANIGIICIKNQ